jgi:hypothetical protein
MTAQLQHLAQAYFHQDYDLEFTSPDEVVAAFVGGEGPAAIRDLALEIDHLLAAPLDEPGLEDLWVKTLGAAFDPTSNGQTYRAWFAHVRDSLQAGQP